MQSAGPEEWSEVYWLFNSIKVYTAGGNGTTTAKRNILVDGPGKTRFGGI